MCVQMFRGMTMLESLGQEDGSQVSQGPNLRILRAGRVLRPLKLVSGISSMFLPSFYIATYTCISVTQKYMYIIYMYILYSNNYIR